jgi:hypothetical protein
MPDPTLLEAFMELAGPWGLVGLLLLYIWVTGQREERSVRELLQAQTDVLTRLASTFEALAARFQEHCTREEVHDARVADALDRHDERVLDALRVRREA